MAEGRSILRTVRAIFDRAAGKKMESEFEDSLKRAGTQGGKQAGAAAVTELRREFEKKKADLAHRIAVGTISEKEFKKQTALATATFRTGILRLMDEAKAKGAAGEREYVKLARTLKRVGDEGQRDIGRLNSGMSRLQSIALKVTAVLGSLWVVRRVADFTKEVFNLGASVLAVGNQFDTVFGDELGQLLRERTEELRLMAGLTRKQSEEILAGAGSMAQGFGMAKAASADFAQQILELSADLASFNVVPTAQAAQLVQSALIGNTEAARSLKVAFTALDVQKRALAMTDKEVASELTQAEKALAALAVMTERAGPMIGDLNRTQNDSDNVAKQLAGSYQQVKESLAAVLVQGTAGQLGLTMLRDLFRDLDQWVIKNSESIQGWASVVVKSVGNVSAGFMALFRAVKAVAEIFSGVLFGVLAAGARGFSLLAEAAAFATTVKARLFGLFSPALKASMLAEAAAIRDNAKAIREWAAAAEETARTSLRAGLALPRGATKTPGAVGGPPPETPATPPPTPLQTPTGTAAAGRDKEAEALARLQEKQDAYIANTVREIEVHGRRSAAILQGEEAVEALNRELFIEQEVLRSGAEAGTEFHAVVMQLAAAQYDAAEAARDAADSMQSDWSTAIDAISEEMAGFGEVAGGIFQLIASSGIAGLAQLAKAKVIENLAWAIENTAKALGALNPFASAKFTKAAITHVAAAAKWGAVGVAASALSGGGGGSAGGGVSGSTAPDTRSAERAEPAGPEIHLNLVGDGFDAVNPRVQDVVAGAMTAHTERYGNVKVYHYRNGRRVST